MKKETVEIISKGIVAAIPYVGSTVISVWSDIQATQAKRKLERLEEFLTSLKDDVEMLKGQIQTSYTDQPDFLDIFEETTKYIVSERTEEKRIMFRNILVNSIIEKDCTYDKTEKYLRILDQMNNLELLILRILENPVRYNKQEGEIIKDPNQRTPGVINLTHYEGVYQVSEILYGLIKTPKEDIAESLYFLEANRLVMEKASSYRLKTNGHPIHTLDDKLTLKGKDFISFIIQ